MRALITGITGFAGTHLAEHLLAQGDEVLGTNRTGRWSPDVPEVVASHARLWAWDLARDRPPPHELGEQPIDCVYHLAAVSVPEDCGDVRPTHAALNVNAVGTLRMFRWAEALARRPRVILASSSHVYSPVDEGNETVSEVFPTHALQAYGHTKLGAEAQAHAAVDRGMHVTIVRAFGHTGPRQAPRMIVPQWAEQLARGGPGPIEVYTLDASLDLCDVRDVVRGYRMLAEDDEPIVTYNLGSSVRRRSRDVLADLQRIAGTSRGVIETRPGVKRGPIADIEAVRKRFGWRPDIAWESTLRDTMNYWRQRLSVPSTKESTS